jgi:Ca2+-binding RTX toxin-like protein
MDVADTNSNGAKPTAPAQSSHDEKAPAVALAPAGESIVTSIHRPAPGSITVIEVAPGAHLKLDFASTEVKFAVLDVDLVLLFPDGAKVILPGYAFNLVGPESADATFTDTVVSPQQLLAHVDELHLLNDNAPLLGSGTKVDPHNQDQEKQTDDKKEITEDAPPAATPQPAAPSAKITAVADFDKPPEPPADRSLKKPADDAIPAAAGSAPGSHHTADNTATSTNTNTSTNTGTGDGNVSAANLSITLLGVSGDQTSTLPSGGVKILGAASEIPATTDSAFAVQQQMRTLVGTSQNDVIYAANPDRMPAGTTERLIDVHVSFPDAGITAKTATITNLPPGYAINNGTQSGSNWIVALDPTDPNHLQLELRYVLPTSATHPDANGFLGSFNLSILFGTVDSTGATRLYSGTQTFVIRDITSASDVEITSADGKSTIYGLNATPPGATISAGAGDDLVYAGPGRDNLDGGTGNNTVSYKYSNEGVTVDLSAGTGHGGYAEGDVLQNFTNIEGSQFADRLTGTAGDNTFIGSGGGDTIIGNGGTDTVDYSGSATGVTVNLTTGVGSAGLASGDTLIGISNLIGSATGNNTLIGNSGANVITGGAGNDVIDGAGGADTLIGAGGNDTIVYRGSELSIDGGTGTNTLSLATAVVVDLANVDQTTGDSVNVTNFQNVDASALTTGISITGSTGINVITGGSGADTIDGGGGADVIHAGAGNDTVTYRGTEALIDGGGDTNTLVMLAQANVNLAAADQTSGDATTVTNFQNVDASALSSGISITGSAGVNVLIGGAGNDTIDGGGGSDTINGGAGDDTIAYRGTENAIDGGSGNNTLLMLAAAIVDLHNADQTAGDATNVANFINVDASGLSVGVDITGSAGNNIIKGGSGDDTLDGAGGADTISGGAGNDTITYRGTELSIDGGTAIDTLVLAASGGITQVNFAVAANADQTIGDAVNVTHFENLDGSALSSNLTVTGSTSANSIITGSGNDAIDGGGGADVIAAGAGDDTVSYRGSESSIDGGTGTNTIRLLDATDINLGRTDQSIGDSTLVSNFQNVDASALGTGQGVSIIGSSGANILTGGAGADVINGGGGADIVNAGAGDDSVSYSGTEVSLDGGSGTNTLVLRASAVVDLANADQTSGDSTNVANFQNVDASALTTGSTITGSAGANTIIGGSGNDLIDGAGGADIINAGDGNDTVFVHGTELSIDGGNGNDTLVLPGSSTVTSVNFSVAAGLDQTAVDTANVTNFENVDATAMTTGLIVTGSLLANTIQTGSGDDSIHGGGGGDAINAGAGNDSVDYLGSEVSIDGGAGSNTLVLRASANVDLSASDQTVGDSTTVSNFINVDASAVSTGVSVLGSAAVNVITGGSGADTLDGGGGADTINAGGGNDTVTIHGTEFAVDGGAGSDTLVVGAGSSISAVNFAVASGFDQTSGDAVLVSNFESLDASALTTALTVTGSSAANTIITGSGNDVVDGGGGADIINTGAGDDTVTYYGTEASVNAGSGVNTLVLETATDINLGHVDQTVSDAVTVSNFQNVDASALGSAQGINIVGSAVANLITGGAGNDTIDGGGGADIINAGAGDDIVAYRGTEASLAGGAGTNTLQLKVVTTVDLANADQTTGDGVSVSAFENVDASALGAAQGVAISGDTQGNSITGGAGADTIDGRGGADVIDAGSGNDTVHYHGTEIVVDGGFGSNTLVLDSPGGITRVDLSVAPGSDQTIGDTVNVADFQNIDASILTSGIVVTGSSSVNTITTGSGNDTIDGGGGADTINAGTGNDVVSYYGSEVSLDGGSGTNTLVLRNAATVDLGSADQTTGDAVTVVNFTNVDASALAVGATITGSAAANTITGGAGNDTIDGGGGADIINAGGGDDSVVVRGTETSIDGGTGSDTLVLAASSTVTAVNFALAPGTDQTVGDTVSVVNFENLNASAMTTALNVTGSSGANVITTGSADDTIHGGGGADIINAGAGNDAVDYWGTEVSIDGGAGANTLIVRASATIDLSAPDQSAGDLATVTNFQNVDASGLTAIQVVSVTGSSGANTITGGAGADVIDGGGGADIISAGAGNDSVTFHGTEASVDGGAGSDTLALLAGSTITAVDFSVTAGNDQTSGDGTSVTNFENLDGSALTTALTVTGSSAINAIQTGSADDLVDGGGGLDVISTGAGNDTVTYRGTELSIDGGTGTNTLILQAATDINLGRVDQTVGDAVTVMNFGNVDASALSATDGANIIGNSSANTIIGGLGNDVIDGAGGADVVSGGGGDDIIGYRGSEASIDGGSGSNTLQLKAATTVNLANADQTSGDSVNVTNFENVDASGLTAVQGISITGTAAANTITGGAGADTIDGGGGTDVISAGGGNDSVQYYGSEISIDGGSGNDTLVLAALGGISLVNLGVPANVDQTSGDGVDVFNFENVDASALSTAIAVTGSSAANIITTGSGADTIDGGGGADVISAGAGDDAVSYYGTEASLDGGSGTNTLVLKAATGSIDLNNVDQTTGDATNVSNFQNVDASALVTGATITGSTGINIITGGAGADTIDGGGGADVINAAGGDDTVVYRGSESTIDGGSGSDTLVLGAGAPVTAVNFAVAAGVDQTAGDSVAVKNFENLNASAMTTALSVTGSLSGNTIITGSGDDTIQGGAGADVINAGGGNDSVDFWGSEVSIDGGTGSNTLMVHTSAAIDLSAADQTLSDLTSVTGFQNIDASALNATQSVSVLGSSAANTITGGAGADVIDGGGGADIISAGGGNDTVTIHGTEASVDGGAGSDTLILTAGTSVSTVDFGVLAGSDQTGGDSITVTNFESLLASAVTTALSVTGSSAANVITTGSGNDTIDSGGGADIIDAGTGNDSVSYRGTEASIDGGGGTDTLVLKSSGGISTVDLSGAAGSDQTFGDSVAVSNFENVDASVLLAAQGITIIGSTGANTITGGAGADVIDGNGGADVISGAGGNDAISFYGTETSIDGGTGTDTLILAASGGMTAVDFSVAAGSDQTTGDTVSVKNFENLDASVVATALAVTGSSSANVITTGAGNDTIDGGGGADILNAGAGNDTVSYYNSEVSIDGGAGINTLLLRAVTTVNLGNLDQTSGDAVSVNNFQNVDASALSSGISITGSAGANVLTGGSGNDAIDGAGGADTIDAGAGNDTVTFHGTETAIDGGAGADTLVITSGATVGGIDFSVAAGADQTTGDSTLVKNFENLDASLVTSGVTVTGSSAANIITTGAGNDTIDGGGGADVINANAGNDTVSYYGSENLIDGGTGSNTLLLKTVTTVNLGNVDQTTGDATNVANFQNVDATALSASVSITGSSAANIITTGAGNDTIDGAGGADVIGAGAGDDSVSYYGTEASIDGGAGINTLVMRTAATVNLANADQTIGDTAGVTNFQNVDASALSSALSITGSSGVNVLTGGSGNDTIDGGGGADVIAAGAGNDSVSYRGTETSIDGGTGTDTLVLAASGGTTAVNFGVATNVDQTTGDSVNVTNFENLDATAVSSSLTVIGSVFANTITMGAGNDVIDGGGGADVISAGAGNDTVSYYGTENAIDGGTGTNTLALKTATTVNLGSVDQTTGDSSIVSNFQNVDASALSSGVTITGSVNANVITGGSGNDTIDGGGGADVISGGLGDDTISYRGTEVSIDGGVGTDTLVVGAGAAITAVNFSVAAGGDQTTGDAVTVTNFENLDSSLLNSALTVTGSAAANVITTGGGNDVIDGGGGGDVIGAGAGNDTVSYYGTEVSIDGGTGTNTLALRAATTVNLGNVDQTTGDLTAVGGFQNVDASAMTAGVSITGSSSGNVLTGGSGADTIDGAGGADSIAAGGGNDTVTYHGTETSIDGGSGSDTLVLAAAGGVTAVNFTVAAGADQTAGDTAIVANFENVDASVLTTALTVTGSSSANTITTGSGNDTIDGGGGADVINAGAGDDTVSYYNSEVSIDGGAGINTLLLRAAATVNLGGADQTIGDAVGVANFQNVNASLLSTGVAITGTSGANTIIGGSGADSIDGAGGADIINAGGGNDSVIYQGSEVSIDGGTGSDTLILAASGGITAVNFAVAAGLDQTIGDAVAVANFENLDASIVTTALSVTASSSANTITTGSGNDTIDGGGGADVISAGAGDDTVSYYNSEVSIDGGTGTNTLILKAAITVNLANSDQTTGDTATVSNFQNVDASALSSAVSITGTSSANQLIGGAGNDTIDGGDGADIISAGAGNDSVAYYGSELSIDGGTGTNTLVMKVAATVNLANADQTIADTTNVTSFQNVDASALSSGVSITGSSSANTIIAGSGNDAIDGGGGADTINAGAGDDTVIYHGSEVSIDGNTGTDTLIVSAGSTLSTVNFAVAAGSDQTTGDSVSVTNFENLDASALTTAVVVTGSAFANTITTGSGNDVIDGGGGTDTILAGAGDDTVSYYGSETSLDGGTGTNTLLLKAAATITLGAADQTSGDSTGVTNFQNVDASALAAGISITGSSGANTIVGGFGNDSIDGAGGADVINANGGDDTVTYQGTEASIDGGTGSDMLVLAATGGITAVNFAVAAGADQTTGDSVVVANFENLDGSVATSALTVQGSSGINIITTGSGNDSIDGGGGADILVAGGGDDTVSYRGTEFSIDGGTGTNTLLLRAVTTVNLGNFDQTLGDVVSVTNFQNVDASQLVAGVSITGSAGTNVLTGSAGNDAIDGAGGADIIAAGAGADSVTYRGSEASIDGGTGSDTLVMAVAGGTTAVDLSVAAGTDQTIGDVVGVTNFENLDASSLSTALTVTGSSSANVITTGSGNDSIDGGGGADIIAAGTGDDSVVYRGSEVSIDGGGGINTLVMNAATTINLGNIDQSTGDVTAITNFQNVDASALSAAVSITGNSGVNTITGGSGADTIDGGGGADIISAGAGDDTVSYRGTEVSIDGQAGTNTLLLRAAVTVNLANADQTTGDSTNVATFQNVDASLLSSGVTITGSSGVNLLTGSSGNDTIDGGGGADTILAGAGNDSVTFRGTEFSIDGGNGADTLVLSTAAGITSVNFAVAAGLDQTVGDTVSVSNFENLDASALASALTVTGSAAANTITTGAGNDTIDGGGGADIIAAGAGNDTVSYYGAETSIDGGAGTNTLTLRTAVTVNLANPDQTSGDTTTVANFQNVDASTLATGVSLTGSSGANTLTGGAGNDTVDGGGGADVIATGGGDDVVTYRGTETSIDAGSGVDTLVMAATGGTTAVNFSVAAGTDQTTGDSTAVANFENLNASALSTGIIVTGSTSTNIITTGSGDDTIDGNGGGDTITAGAGNDIVAYWGTETSLDGGTGNNTLQMKVTGTVNLAAADQTSGDVTTVTNFQNVDASGLTTGASITGTSGVNILTGGSGNDSVDGGGGADIIALGGGNDSVTYRGAEVSIDGGSGTDTLNLAAIAGITAVNFSVAAGTDQTVGDTVSVTNFENLNASVATTALTVTGSTGANNITTGSGADTIDGKGGGDAIAAGAGNDTVDYYATESSLDGGTGTNTLILQAAATINLGNVDQTTGDLTTVTNFQNVDGTAIASGMNMTGSSGANTITGGSGDDVIDGAGGADTIAAGAGNDTVWYRSGMTSIDGGAGTNTLNLLNNVTVNLANADQTTGDSANVTNFQNVNASLVAGPVSITGSSVANSITGSTGNDTIDGGGGADVIDAGTGNDTVTYRGTEVSIDGNSGTDKLVLAAAGGITAINLSISTDQTTGDTVTVSNFESVDASVMTTAVTVTGSSSSNTITTGSGDDTIHGGGGADVIVAGSGNDTVDYFGAETSIDGGTGSNTLVVKAVSGLTAVNLAATAGTDITTGDTVSVLNFQNLNSSAVGSGLTVTGSSAANSIITGSGVDTIDGGGGADTISSGGGDDVITYRGTETSIDASTGNDTLVLAAGGGITAINLGVAAGADQTTGDSVAVSNFEYVNASALSTGMTITGSSGTNFLTGGSGADTIDGAGGADVIAAGAGNDSVTYRGSEVSIDGGTGANTLVLATAATINLANADQTSADLVTVTNFQNVDASALSTGVAITGTSSANTITGGTGADSIDGAGGADVLSGGAGDDSVAYYGTESSIDGGTGTNTLMLRAATTVNLASADVTTSDSISVVNFLNVDASALGTAVTMTGSSAANTITGGSGNDTIDGGGGADIINAGSGNDAVTYRGTEASIDGGGGTDTLTFSATGSVTAINLTNADQTTGDSVAIANFENVNASIFTTALTVTGSSVANSITTGSGDDTIDGGGGADVIVAGSGNDTVSYYGSETSVDGGTGTNTLILNTSAVLNLANANQLSFGAGTISNFQNVNASAVSAAVSITGSSGANVITGGSGNDTIDGAGGADTLAAGAGNDTVSYYGTEVSVDGGTGTNTLILKAATTVNLGSADQTSGDSVNVTNFQNVDASAVSSSMSITGSSAANTITAGSGDDTVDGGGGADVINAGGGNDTVAYRGTETSIDGGAGSDTLVLSAGASVTAVNFTVSSGVDQTTGDSTSIMNFENVNASVLSTAVTVTGSSSANTITTGSGNDTVDGGGGADVIAAGGGNDSVSYYGNETSIDGGTGTNTLVMRTTATVNLGNADQTSGDTPNVTNFQNIDASALSTAASLTGSSSANTITGGSGADTIDGSGGADIIAAGSGNDTVTYRGTEASIDGGAGIDTLVLAASGGTTAVNFSVTAGSDQTTGDSVSVINFESIDASLVSSALTLTGSSSANTITGGSGNDTIDGGGGADIIAAGGGNDTVTYRGSETSIDGGTGTNTLLMSVAATINLANADQTAGDSTAVSNFQNVDASALSTALSITGSSAANTITGGSGNDAIDGGGGADIISAGGGNDTVTYRGTETSIDGGTGTNTLLLNAVATVNLANVDQTSGDSITVGNFQNVDASALSSSVTLTGSSSANTITGGSSDDTIDGGGGADIIAAGGGNDSVTYRGTEASIDGGAGSDTLVLAAAGGITAVNFSVAAGVDQTTGDTTSATNFENLNAGILSTAVTVTGSAAANTITTGSGNDTIDGGGGADVISAGAGNDTVSYYAAETSIDGGTGTNTLSLKAAVTVNLGNADVTSGDAANVTNFQNVDASALSSAVSLTGSSSANTITGGSGADTIDGGGGADIIAAGGGNDTVTYQGTETSIDGGAGTDTLVLAASGGVTAVNFSVAGGSDQTTGDSVSVTNFESIDASLVSSALTLTGSSSANTITGGSGNDTIDGGGGADVIAAGGGNDTVTYRGSETSIDGGSGTNTLVMNAAATVNLGNGDQTSGDSTAVSNFQNINASALSAALSLTGSSGANTITSGSGNDTIDGAGGADVIAAGAGNDLVAYYGTEVSIDGGIGANTLVLDAAATVNLSNADQTSADSVNVTNFLNIDASALSAALSLTGSSLANTITGGSGNDTIDGGGGADVIVAGAGNDTVTYHGTETSIDGGVGGSDTLVLASSGGITAVNFAVGAGADQTTGDTVGVTNFDNLDASILSSAVSVTGSSSANTITTGSGNDVIDGGSGADIISAGGGNDTVTYHGTETSIDGGGGTNTLVMASAATVNLGNADQTSGDTTNVTSFQNVDASGLSSGVSITGSSSANTITGGSGSDTIDGAGGADVIIAGGGNDTVTYHGTETSIDGGSGTNTLVLNAAATVNLGNADQTSGDSTNVTNFQNVDGSSQSAALTITGSSSNNTLTGGSGNDTISGGGGTDHLFGGGGDDIFIIDHSSLALGSTIDGGSGNNTVNISANSGTVGDAELVASLTNVETIDFTASNVNASLNLSGSQISQIAGGAANTLTLLTNGGDAFNLTDPGSNYSQSTVGNITNFTIYDDASHTNVVAHLALVA